MHQLDRLRICGQPVTVQSRMRGTQQAAHRELAMTVKKEWAKPEICEADVGMEVTGYQTAETETETEVLF
jgi:coenzyme PQQ precursor peptide PqqA